MATVRMQVELLFDDEVGTWHFAIPALHAVGGGAKTREEAAAMAAEAAAFALESDDEDGKDAGYLRVTVEPEEALSA